MDIDLETVKIEEICRCCLSNDSHPLIDMRSTKFQNHDQLLIFGYKSLIGEDLYLSNNDINAYTQICQVCLAQLEATVGFRDLCLQANGLLSARTCMHEDIKPNVEALNNQASHGLVTFTNYAVEEPTVQTVTKAEEFQLKRAEESLAGEGRKRSRKKNRREPKIYKCSLCPGIYRRKKLIEAHVKEHIENRKKPVKCNKEIFFEKYSNNNESDESVIKCPECDKSLRSVVELNRHIQKHANLKHLKCTFCPSEFTFEKDFKDHQKIHEAGFPIKCADCPKTFNAKRSLTYHQKTHHLPDSETKWYPCEVCEKKFTYGYMLFEHSFIHKNFNPFHCTACKFNTCRKTEFKRHLRSHGITFEESVHGYVESESHKLPLKLSGDYQHECAICEKRFANKIKLSNHLKMTHSNSPKSECEDCGQKFLRPFNLKRHRLKHHNIIKIECQSEEISL